MKNELLSTKDFKKNERTNNILIFISAAMIIVGHLLRMTYFSHNSDILLIYGGSLFIGGFGCAIISIMCDKHMQLKETMLNLPKLQKKAALLNRIDNLKDRVNKID